MTITQYERRLLTAPGHIRFTAARPAYALRQRLRDGEGFTAARDDVLATPWLFTALFQTGRLNAFRNLTP